MRNVMKKAFKIAATVLLSGIIMFMVYLKSNFIFETNDDRIISEILSGAMTGSPESHVIYVNWLLSYPLSLLYRISARVPWYGGMFLLFHLLVYSALFYSLWCQKRKAVEYIVLTVLACCWILANYYVLSLTQFTSTAALMAVMGYGCLILRQDKGWKMFILFELLAFLLRSQAMLMIQLLGGAACVGFLLVNRRQEIRVRCKKAGMMIGSLAGILVIGYIGTRIGYGGAEWKDFNRYNVAQIDLLDFYGMPDYESVKPILDEHDVSRAEYVAFCNYVVLNWNVSADCMEELAQYMKEHSLKKIDIRSLWEDYWTQIISREYLGLNMVVGLLWCVALLWVILGKKWYLLVPFAGLALGRTAAWGYLIYRERLLLRVTLPLLSCEAFLLLVFLIQDYLVDFREAKAGLQRALAVLLCGVFAFSCYSSGKEQYARARDSQWQISYIEGLVEVHDYCNQRPENRYLLDSWSFSMYYRGTVLETRIYQPGNCTYTGTWYSNSPPMENFLNKYLENGSSAPRLIVYDEGSGESFYTVVYLAEEFGKNPVIEDRFTVSHGGSYLVWAFE